jgi:hypothetical protein
MQLQSANHLDHCTTCQQVMKGHGMCAHDTGTKPENCAVCRQEQALQAQEHEQDDKRQKAARLTGSDKSPGRPKRK